MSDMHPAFDSAYPPSPETFAGSLMLDVAIGMDEREDIEERIDELLESDEFAEVFPGEPEPTAEEARSLLERVIAEHDRVVAEESADSIAFANAIGALFDAGVVASFEGYDAIEAAHDAYALAEEMRADGADVRGYVYCHREDLERVVFTGRLVIGFSSLSAEPDETARIGRVVLDALVAAGLAAAWSGDPGERILIDPMRWEGPFEDDDEDVSDSES